MLDYLVTYKSGHSFIVKDVYDTFRGDGLIILEIKDGREFYNIDMLESVTVWTKEKEDCIDKQCQEFKKSFKQKLGDDGYN